MNERPTTVPFTPRTASNCIDLAVLYCGRELRQYMTLWVCACVPSCVLVYTLTNFYEFDLRLVLLVVYLATTVLGGWLAAAVAPGVFERIGRMQNEDDTTDEPRSSTASGYLVTAAVILGGIFLALAMSSVSPLGGFRDKLSLLAAVLIGIVLFCQAAVQLRELNDRRIRVTRPVMAAFAMRVAVGFAPIALLSFMTGWTIFLAIVFAIIPGLPLAARFGFVAERACLTQYDRRLHHSSTDDLIKSEIGDLFLRLCGIGIFYCILWIMLFFTVDTLCSLIFRIHILTGRISDLDFLSTQLWSYLSTNPLLLTTLTATGLLAYPIVRIAWFLCYIDLRVRRDCWDLELSLSREAKRLREAG